MMVILRSSLSTLGVTKGYTGVKNEKCPDFVDLFAPPCGNNIAIFWVPAHVLFFGRRVTALSSITPTLGGTLITRNGVFVFQSLTQHSIYNGQR